MNDYVSPYFIIAPRSNCPLAWWKKQTGNIAPTLQVHLVNHSNKKNNKTTITNTNTNEKHK
jgi:hypothetical protein